MSDKDKSGKYEKIKKMELVDNSIPRVALDLAKLIAGTEIDKKDRAYWLKLYAACREAVTGPAGAASED
jgi:hypothetical protein